MPQEFALAVVLEFIGFFKLISVTIRHEVLKNEKNITVCTA